MNQLQFPYDRPILNPTLYTLETFPATINITNMALLPGADMLMNRVIVSLANEISSTCSNSPMRMFAYNALSSNAWNNNYFKESCQFIANSCVYQNLKTGMAVSIAEVVKTALSTIVGVIAAANQSFLVMLDPTVQQQSYKNANIYKEHCQMFMNMITTGVGQNTMNGMGNMMGMGNANMRNNLQLNGPPGLDGALTINGGQNTGEVHTRFGPVNTGTRPPERKRTEVKQVDVKEVVHGVIVPVVDIGDKLMDESKHCQIYGSPAQAFTQEARASAVNELKEAIAKQSKDNFDAENGEVVEDTGELMLAECEQAAFDMIHAAAIMNSNKTIRIIHDHCLLLEYVLAVDSLDDLAEKLRTVSTFAAASDVIRAFYETDSPSKTNSPRSHFAAISVIDRWLTKNINVFLASLTPSRGISITSFVEDIADVPVYISSELGLDSHRAYMNFQARAMKHWFKESRHKHNPPSYLKDSMVSTMILARMVDVSYLNTSLLECGLEDLSNGSIIKVVKNKTPLLYRLVSDADAISKRNGEATEHVFLTIDGTAFTVEELQYERDAILLVARE